MIDSLIVPAAKTLLHFFWQGALLALLLALSLRLNRHASAERRHGLAVLALVALAWRRAGTRLLGACVLLFPLPYYVTHFMERYRYPVEPVMLFLCAWLVLSLWNRVGGSARETQ